MMFLPRLYARLCARQAGRTLLASRITQNYSQFMRCPEADVPPDFLRQNALEMSGFHFVEQIFPPALWRRNVRFDLHARVAAFTREQDFYSQPRTLLLGMRWAGFGLIADALLATAPDDVRFQFVTQAGDQKAWLTDVSTRFLTRYGYVIRTLLPGCSLHSAEFALESQTYAPAEYRQAATATLNALRKTPTLWSAWDDLSVIYHG